MGEEWGGGVGVRAVWGNAGGHGSWRASAMAPLLCDGQAPLVYLYPFTLTSSQEQETLRGHVRKRPRTEARTGARQG